MTLAEVTIPKTQEEKKAQLEQVSNPFFEVPEEEIVEDTIFLNKFAIVIFLPRGLHDGSSTIYIISSLLTDVNSDRVVILFDIFFKIIN